MRLAGTLTRPRLTPPFAAAILIAGSGAQDRNASIAGHKPFLVIADYLTRQGMAVLRLDARGVGQSTGNLARATQADLAGDVLAAVQYLKIRNDIDSRHIGVICQGEGALAGTLAAVQSESIGFVVMLASPGIPGGQLFELQAELLARANGAKDPGVAKQRELEEIMFGVLKAEPDEKAAAEKMREAWTKIKTAVPEAQRKNLEDADAAIDAQFAFLNSPNFRSALFLDPADTLKKLKTPVLVLNGSRDQQVTPGQNLPPITAALAGGGNPDFTVSELPGLNHLFQTCRQCGIGEYGTIEETFSPVALEIVGGWVARHVRPR